MSRKLGCFGVEHQFRATENGEINIKKWKKKQSTIYQTFVSTNLIGEY
ncbi:hypothetical protein [Flavobacterium sp.]|nr:hypothetical protein [Flavobacterium sp.]